MVEAERHLIRKLGCWCSKVEQTLAMATAHAVTTLTNLLHNEGQASTRLVKLQTTIISVTHHVGQLLKDAPNVSDCRLHLMQSLVSASQVVVLRG